MEDSKPAVSHHSLMLEETVTARLNQIYKTRSHAVSAPVKEDPTARILTGSCGPLVSIDLV